ncbi:hypothetical protein BK004_01575 [bacterium CG10_46_32]|nr:MAG: hypothetical protein BK004_01575 [bacterium CG10_46_32]PIR56273.1 MAG: hypothetical protein COU73_01595 [Parcubacteria group bacterium CG10_big_fil_rev_8_21_14_0_10_46_32]
MSPDKQEPQKAGDGIVAESAEQHRREIKAELPQQSDAGPRMLFAEVGHRRARSAHSRHRH